MDKWYAIAVICFIGAMCAGAYFTNVAQNDCRKDLSTKNYSAEDIVRICH